VTQSSIGSIPMVATSIDVGQEVTRKVFGMTVDVFVVASTVIAGLIVIGMGLYARKKATSGVPGKLQLFWETVVIQVEELVETSIGPAGKAVVPLATAIFFFILIANYIEIVPTGATRDLFPAPTGDVNLPYAMALTVIILVHVASIRTRGIKGYIKHYFQPLKAFFPINVIEEITKPITLSLRLFGNLFAGGLMLSLIAVLLPVYIVPFGDVAWKLFDMFIGFIQAFIFSLLTVVYFGMAMDTSEH